MTTQHWKMGFLKILSKNQQFQVGFLTSYFIFLRIVITCRVFFNGNFLPPRDKKKKMANSTKGFLKFFFKKSPYLKKKKQKLPDFDNVFYQVARIKQDFKNNLLVHQDSHHSLLINVEDPCQYSYLKNLKKKHPNYKLKPISMK